MEPELDTKPSNNPFARYPVIAVRVETDEEAHECFLILEFDLTNDDLGPTTAGPPLSETEARRRLAELGFAPDQVDARITWARRWLTTHRVKGGNKATNLLN